MNTQLRLIRRLQSHLLLNERVDEDVPLCSILNFEPIY